MPTYSEYVLAKADQALPVPGTKLVDLVDPSTGVVTKTPVSNIGGGNPLIQTLTDGASIAMNVANGKWAKVTIAGNRTFSFSGLLNGDAGLIFVRQNGTGGFTITWTGATLPSGGLALSAGANELTVIGYAYENGALILSKENYGVVAGDTDPPGVVSMRVENATPNRIDILYDESLLTTPLPANGDFAVTGKTISSIAIVGNTVRVTVSVAFGSGDTASIGYTIGSNPVKDAAGNNAPAITLSTGNVTNAVGSSYQAESDTFFAANTGLSTPQKDALDALVVSMKAIGWSKFKAVYPLIGGSAAAHKWNLVNPVDTDGGFRLVFNGTITHNANGITGGGTVSDFADTKLNPSTVLTSNAGGIGAYVRSGWDGTETIMGAFEANKVIQMAHVAGDSYWFSQSVGVQAPAANPSAFTRLCVVNRTSSIITGAQKYRDATNFGESNEVSGTYPNYNVYLGGRNNAGTCDTPSNAVIAFAFVSDGLSAGDVATLNTAINSYQTALSRNV